MLPLFYFAAMKTIIRVFFYICIVWLNLFSQILPIPDRISSAPAGSQFNAIISSLSLNAREDTIFEHITHGNIPQFLRNLVTVSTTKTIDGTSYTLEYFVTPDYLSVGSDSDYFLMPMTPVLAQRIANAMNCTLPTAKMVDQIYLAANVKLRPQPIPPDNYMMNVPRFWQHNDSVKALRNPLLGAFPLGSLVGGTKKDVIIDKKIYSWLKPSVPKPVVIYGWHQLNGIPIQPTYNGHGETYADYSHGIRLVLRQAKINGAEISLIDLMKDPVYYSLVSDTVIVQPFYESLTTVKEEQGAIISPIELYQNYPNPFNPDTNIQFTIQKNEAVTIRLFDSIGKEVAILLNDNLSSGTHLVIMSANQLQLSSGIYFYMINTPTFSQTHKMAYIK